LPCPYRFVDRQIVAALTNRAENRERNSLGVVNTLGLPDGRTLVTLRDAGDYIASLPKKESNLPEWQAAIEALIRAADLGGPTMFARIGVMQALNRGVERGDTIAAPTSLRRIGVRMKTKLAALPDFVQRRALHPRLLLLQVHGRHAKPLRQTFLALAGGVKASSPFFRRQARRRSPPRCTGLPD
jgi:hypothetical protein